MNIKWKERVVFYGTLTILTILLIIEIIKAFKKH
jgi:hypothetical protein